MVALPFRGDETRESVCSFVLLSCYMHDGDFIKLGDGVADRVIIALEEGFFDFKIAFYLTDDQLRVTLVYDFACSQVVCEV